MFFFSTYHFVFSVETEVRKLAEEVSTEDDDELQFDRPVRILKIIRDLVKTGNLYNRKSNDAEKKDTSTQTSFEISKDPEIQGSAERLQTEDIQIVKALPKRCDPPRNSDDKKAPFFHTNIRVIPKVRTDFVPILPRPIRSPAKTVAPAPQASISTPENLNEENNVKKSSRPKERQDSVLNQQEQMSANELFDKIELEDLGKKIATAIPVNLEDVNSKNISDIADKYLDDDDLFNNLLEAYSSFNPTSEIESDQEMNTPVTSPTPDDINQVEFNYQNIELPSQENRVLTTDNNENREVKTIGEEEKNDADKLDTLAQLVQNTINVVTEEYDEKDSNTGRNEATKLPTSKEPRVRKQSSKSLKKRKEESNGRLSSFQRQLKSIIGANSSVIQKSSDSSQLDSTPMPNDDNLMMSKFTLLCNEKIVPPKEVSKNVSVPNEAEKPISVNENSKMSPSNQSSRTNRKQGKPKRQRCLHCAACLSEPCGKCLPCRDKVSNGGRGTLKKGCM